MRPRKIVPRRREPCPVCGSPPSEGIAWQCGSQRWHGWGEVIQSSRCRVAQLTAERDRLKAACHRHKRRFRQWWRSRVIGRIVDRWRHRLAAVEEERDQLRAEVEAMSWRYIDDVDD